MPFKHEASMHTVSAAYFSHSPAAPQAPVFPQEVGSSALHSLSGSVPGKTTPHTPSSPPVFAPRHDLHGPTQSLLQQTPSVHDPAAHSLVAPHASPWAFLASHWPLMEQ
jgi:hypothetical protein